ncbi:hypothetical protein ABZP36_013228 [Zizania latifolia]
MGFHLCSNLDVSLLLPFRSAAYSRSCPSSTLPTPWVPARYALLAVAVAVAVAVARGKVSGEMEAAADEEEQQEGISAQSPAQAPPSSTSSLPKVEMELRVLQALEFYPPSKLKGIHRHFVLYALMEYLEKSLDRQFSADEVLQLLDRFFNLEMLKPEDDEKDNFSQGEEFSLPGSFF